MSDALLEQKIKTALKQVKDPELGINVVDLGLIYDLKFEIDQATVVMTMTSPSCPMNAFLSDSVKKRILKEIPEINSVEVEIVWDPPWNPQRMSIEARRILGFSTES